MTEERYEEILDELADLHTQLIELSRRVEELEAWRSWQVLEDG